MKCSAEQQQNWQVCYKTFKGHLRNILRKYIKAVECQLIRYARLLVLLLGWGSCCGFLLTFQPSQERWDSWQNLVKRKFWLLRKCSYPTWYRIKLYSIMHVWASSTLQFNVVLCRWFTVRPWIYMQYMESSFKFHPQNVSNIRHIYTYINWFYIETNPQLSIFYILHHYPKEHYPNPSALKCNMMKICSHKFPHPLVI